MPEFFLLGNNVYYRFNLVILNLSYDSYTQFKKQGL